MPYFPPLPKQEPVFNPLNALSNIEQVKAQRLQNALSNIKLEQAPEELNYLREMRGRERTQYGQEQTKYTREETLKRAATGYELLTRVKDEKTYNEARRIYTDLYPDATGIPPIYDPEYVTSTLRTLQPLFAPEKERVLKPGEAVFKGKEKVVGLEPLPKKYGFTKEEWEEQQEKLQEHRLALIKAKDAKEGKKESTPEQIKTEKKQKLTSDRYFQTIGRYYQAQRGVGQFIEDPNKEQVAKEALEAAETLAIEYVKGGGNAEELGITAEGIRADYQAEKISKEKAVYLLKNLFGMK